MSMTRHKHDQILAGQLSTVRKVYDAIPIAHAWTIPQIIGELSRLGIRQDTRHIEGCVKALVDCNLVRLFPASRSYQRLYCFPNEEQVAATTNPPPKEPAPMPQAPAKKPTDPLVKLAQHAAYLRNVADDIDEAVLEAMAQLEAAKADSGEKLAKVREALQVLGLSGP